MSLPVTRRNFARLREALRDALPTLKREAEVEVAGNAARKASGYPERTVQQGIYASARAALGLDDAAQP